MFSLLQTPLFHPNDPAWLKESYAKARKRMTKLPRLLEELQKIVRERGRFPQWIEDFIEPVEEIEKSEIAVEFEEDSGDEGITDMENDDSCLEKDESEDDDDGDDEWEEERKASEKEKNNGPCEEDEDEAVC